MSPSTFFTHKTLAFSLLAASLSLPAYAFAADTTDTSAKTEKTKTVKHTKHTKKATQKTKEATSEKETTSPETQTPPSGSDTPTTSTDDSINGKISTSEKSPAIDAPAQTSASIDGGATADVGVKTP